MSSIQDPRTPEERKNHRIRTNDTLYQIASAPDRQHFCYGLADELSIVGGLIGKKGVSGRE